MFHSLMPESFSDTVADVNIELRNSEHFQMSAMETLKYWLWNI
jgi:hypothetical protein